MPRYLPQVLIALIIPILLSCNTMSTAITNFFITDEQEIEMGNKFKAQIDKDTKNYPPYPATTQNHIEVINYVKAMGQQVVKAQTDRDIAFTFSVLADTSINAFAIPGGHIYINIGLLKAATSAAEVAGVVAHEVGHVSMRHGAKQMVKSEGFSIVQQILFGSDSASISSAVSQMLAGMLFLKYSRDDEHQADSCAVVYSVAARYNPYGFKNFFNTLVKMYGDGETSYDIFSTHPKTADRIEHTQAVINKTAGVPAATDTTWMRTAEFAAIKAKI